MSALFSCTCGSTYIDAESFFHHRASEHGDGASHAACANCGKRRRIAEMLRDPRDGSLHCVWCDGEVYLAKQRATLQRTAEYARASRPLRQPIRLPVVPPSRFAEAWED